MNTKFSYEEFITRNIGFVTEKEQLILKKTRVFIPGVGGMGGAVAACLARVGIENFVISDIDHFEISNLNRQIFASLEVIGKDKAEVAKSILLNINPNIQIELRNKNWANELDEILKTTDIVINGCDDIKSTIQLMRKCKEYNVPAIDAFASPFPNVYVIRASDKRPEEVFGFPTVNMPIEKIDSQVEKECMIKEIEYVMVNSSSSDHIDLNIAKEIMMGTKKRISLAPMVWATGCMMAYEVIRIMLNKTGGPNVKGIFFNPWTYKLERPKGIIMKAIRLFFVRRFIKKLTTH